MSVVPTTIRRANLFIKEHHRHSLPTTNNRGRFAIAVVAADEVVGVAIVGNPLSATYMDGLTAEVLRTCVRDGAPKGANSMMYGACRRAWFAMGGRRLITYTLTHESGVSLRAAGWTWEAEVRGRDPLTWGKTDGLSRTDQEVVRLRKNRWQVVNEGAK